MKLVDRLDYTPSELKFGTSGLRGLLTDMTDLECYINTLGFMEFIDADDSDAHTVYLAGDLRHSTPRIMAAVAQAVNDAGLDYVNCGYIPTPAVAYYASIKNQPCIMVTGSHIPDDRNGIKFYKATGEVLKIDEPGIRAAVQQVRENIYSEEIDRFKESGELAQPHKLSDIDDDAEQAYIKRYTDYFDTNVFAGDTIVMYQHSAVGRDLIPEILEKMGAKVVRTARSEKFVPIDTENVRPVDELLFKEIAQENPTCIAIVSTDGDSDRPFVIDETGRFHRGDVLGCVVADYLGSKAVAIPVSSNDAALEFIANAGGKHLLTKIGSPYVIEGMEALREEYENVAGWEVNGGFLTGEDYERNGQKLLALPTRDALLPIICAMLASKDRELKLSELFARLPKRYTQAGLIDNFPNEVSAAILEVLAKNDDTAKRLISDVFKSADGFGVLRDIDAIDGIRIRFDNNDVAHLRPSGNAPQLRIYSNADTQERADEIAHIGVREPDGLLRTLEELITE